MPPFASLTAAATRIGLVLSLALLSACAVSPDPAQHAGGIFDPYETHNRKVHNFNKAVDRNLFGPSSRRYARVVPAGIRGAVNNFSDNISMPSVAVNSLLQGNIPDAGIATLRFALNSTIGLAGLFDAASEFKMPEPDTDFGETLAVWGVGEGAYLELPIFGPTTQRGAVGKVVDLFTNPLTNDLQKPESYYPPASKYLARLNDRARYSDTIESILYDSADSYAQARLIFLQNRRFELGQEALADEADPYEDPYAQN